MAAVTFQINVSCMATYFSTERDVALSASSPVHVMSLQLAFIIRVLDDHFGTFCKHRDLLELESHWSFISAGLTAVTQR